MHIAAIAISVALCIAGYVYMFKAIKEEIEIQHEINLRLPDDQQFEPIFWSYWTWQKFRKLQNKLLPDDPRPQRLRKLHALGFALLVSGIALFLVVLKA